MTHADINAITREVGEVTDALVLPYGVYDKLECGLAYIGLHDSEEDVWRVFLGWPSAEEIEHAKRRGLEVLKLTVSYNL